MLLAEDRFRPRRANVRLKARRRPSPPLSGPDWVTNTRCIVRSGGGGRGTTDDTVEVPRESDVPPRRSVGRSRVLPQRTAPPDHCRNPMRGPTTGPMHFAAAAGRVAGDRGTGGASRAPRYGPAARARNRLALWRAAVQCLSGRPNSVTKAIQLWRDLQPSQNNASHTLTHVRMRRLAAASARARTQPVTRTHACVRKSAARC